MSNKSNDLGRAYEFAFMVVLRDEISKFKSIKIVENSSFSTNKIAWEKLSQNEQKLYILSANAGVKTLFELEPLILDDNQNEILLEFQNDKNGEIGDVRDILITQKQIKWQIGLSLKHNHFALKHSRLSPTIDFGKKWLNLSCSTKYFDEISPIFLLTDNLKKQNLKWSDFKEKESQIYAPLLNAFKAEILRLNSQNSGKIPKLLTQYLLGLYDFYKAISIDTKRITQLQSYNLYGTLNKSSKSKKSTIKIPRITLPNQILSFDFKPNSQNTLLLCLDNGWQFSFRIHNASTKVENSLKFDIQIIGMPTTILTINSEWIK